MSCSFDWCTKYKRKSKTKCVDGFHALSKGDEASQGGSVVYRGTLKKQGGRWDSQWKYVEALLMGSCLCWRDNEHEEFGHNEKYVLLGEPGSLLKIGFIKDKDARPYGTHFNLQVGNRDSMDHYTHGRDMKFKCSTQIEAVEWVYYISYAFLGKPHPQFEEKEEWGMNKIVTNRMSAGWNVCNASWIDNKYFKVVRTEPVRSLVG